VLDEALAGVDAGVDEPPLSPEPDVDDEVGVDEPPSDDDDDEAPDEVEVLEEPPRLSVL
jgi:hypothetical protein